MTSALIFFGVVATLFAGWRAGRRVRFFLHIFQLETYKFGRYGRWLAGHVPSLIVRPSHGVGAVALAGGGLVASVAAPNWGVLAVLLVWPMAFISSRRYRSDQEKKPLAFTDRMVRLAVPTALLALLPVACGCLYGWTLGSPTGVLWSLGGLLVADLGAPLWVALGAALMYPVETAIQRGFKRQARRRLQTRSDLSVVGITGSYGKTSTKFIVAELLRQKYNVYATPSSYNTPMGLCLAVNEHLKPEHQVLVLEYGIRYPGDMDELCDIAEPNASVVTTIGVAHLETMGTQDRIAAEKGVLVERTTPDGPAVLNVDDERVAAMAERAAGPVWRISTEGHPDADITAGDIRYDTGGTAFDVTDDTGTTVAFETQLLGRHNVLNVLLAVAVGRSMGLRLRQMAHAVRRVEPIEHRLQLRSRGDVTIIDDAFNSNPVGARNAVEILSEMDGGKRVIVTPGMVELGDRQWTENKDFGVVLAQHDLDLVVLVGEEQTAPIQAGLSEGGAPAERIMVVDSLVEAQEILERRLGPGDVVLYENDLPDQYSV
ncbi:UDP-N-acetylmuramoyl-tripeptide--D-alanyl-D-alanine ligase [Salinibacter ruber]|uniref:UDP-N-acetylmuramoyl-tripeptide--D-alanyl-D- alanine ligase n=1 Tax=Salinibacter ruber TaxID=146919 RepID=UPI002168D51C|nr:UDP-N-acetylmuramoyl-tripeptide--D-alanyl-D-alanine ligase [Salinibacter ruber]MCS3631667.1 UDP-N-acetylmuramoyl-tripeptide--D-alanyl-D-alanine ligase [Salinibacter ruber]